MNPIPYGRQNITEKDIDSVVQVLRSDYLTQGPAINAFEKAFAKYVDAKYAVAVSNGTAALHLSAIVLGVNRHSKVITTPISFAATANCIRYCDGNIVFADIDPNTALLDINKVKALLEKSPKGTYHGIIPVDFAGYPVDLQSFRDLADAYNLWILADACHSPGGNFKDKNGKEQKCGNGSYADLSIFSFHPVKHIACGEGGMITTNNLELYDRLLTLRTHGITKVPELMAENHGGWYYEMQELGYNYRLSDIQASLGLSQIKRADEGIKRRRQIAEKYDKAFSGTSINSLKVHSHVDHAYHLYIIKSDDRKGLYDYLRSINIFTQVHYIPIHLMPYYKQIGWKEGDFPNAEEYYSKCLSLPIFPSLKDSEQDFVIEEILKYHNQK